MSTKAHQIYKTSDGIIVPSVTTIISLLNKPALVPWANRLGLQGIDVTKFVDKLAEVGTLVHQMILDYFRKVATDTSEYSKEVIDKAENSFLSFLEWVKGKEIIPDLVEFSMVSDTQRFGGTCDLFARVNKIKTLIDFKTGSGIYEEMGYQLAGYQILLMEKGYVPEQAQIVRVPRDETENFEVRVWKDLSYEEQIFNHLHEIYRIKKEMKEVRREK